MLEHMDGECNESREVTKPSPDGGTVSCESSSESIEWTAVSDGRACFDASHLSDSVQSFQDLMPKVSAPNLQPIVAVSDQLADSYKAFNPIKTTAATLSSISESLKWLTSDYRSQMFEAAKAISEVWSTKITDSVPNAVFSGINSSFLPYRNRFHALEVMEKSNWPLYLVGGDDLASDLANVDLECAYLGEEVGEIAERYLDDKWLASVSERWSSHDELGQGKGAMMKKALGYHAAGQYDACVSILMCLFEGLTSAYLGTSFRLKGENEEEAFGYVAKKHRLKSLDERATSKLSAPKDLVLAMSLQADTGWYTWGKISDYIVGVVLANKYEEEIAAHNPLRNKICHGEQTNYGTREHSLKAILATDLLIRLGNAARQGMLLKEGEDQESDEVGE